MGWYTKFKEGEKVVCLRSDGIPEFCVVVDSYFAPSYTVRTENGAGMIRPCDEGDMYWYNGVDLRLLRLRIHDRVELLNQYAQKIESLIEEAENEVQP